MARISPGDAEVALRTFPRRWSTLVGGFEPDDPDAQAILDHPGPDGRSAADCVAEAAAALEAARGNLRGATTSAGHTPAETGARAAGSTAAALRRIDTAAPALADMVRGIPADVLDQQVDVGGRTTTVRALVADVVDQVATLLRTADKALRAGRAVVR
ncbi:MAG: hypothetical protein WD232_04605 [Acidimicrobiales bacterium]